MVASDPVPDGSFLVRNGERTAPEPSIDSDAWLERAAQPSCGTGTAGATESARGVMMADTTLPDGVTVSAGIILPAASGLDAGASNAGDNSPDVSDPDEAANRGDEMSARGANSENATNEAKFDESMIIIQNKEPVGVAANSSVDSGLDKREEQPGRADGKEELIRDTLASSPTADEILRPHLPRSP